MKIAIVGSGISGLGCAWRLMQNTTQALDLTLFEKNDYFGGHSHTVNVTLEGKTYGVDTGFLVFNHRTYPHLKALFADLQVRTAPSDMSFSVKSATARGGPLEWAGSSFNALFAQRRNVLAPRFLHMLYDIIRFNRAATAYAQLSITDPDNQLSLGEYLERHRYSTAFRDDYLLPMAGCIWSCPPRQMLAFPMHTFARFCDNHGLLQITDRPQWYTVEGGARHYVEKIRSALMARGVRFHAGRPVQRVQRQLFGVTLAIAGQAAESFDAVVLATHSDESLAMLSAPTDTERGVLSAIRYQSNTAILHTDATVLPSRRRAWAAWNYVRTGAGDAMAVSVNYLINLLQPLPFTQPVLVSLNPVQTIAPEQVIRTIYYAHPVFDQAAVRAQARVIDLQGQQHTWFCGAWTGYGFHEDGLKSGYAAADHLLNTLQR